MIDGKRVVIVLGSLELGGSERQALLLARYLVREHGAHVQVWGFYGPGRTAELCEEYGIPWRIVSHPLFGWRIRRLKGLIKFALTLRHARPDVILPYTMIPNVACGLIWRWTGAKMCVWNQRDEGLFRMGQKMELWASRKIPWFISNSQHGANFLSQTLEVDSNQIKVIHNGVDLAKSKFDRMAWRKHFNVDDNCFLVCMVANLTDFKDHATLLRAWRIVIDKLAISNNQPMLVLAGRLDTTYESLKTLAFDQKLGETIQFLGKIDDIPGLLSAIDLCVHSSYFEGCPNGVLECMAAGLPVVGTDIPGIREAIGMDNYPFLAPIEDYEGLANRIIEFALNSKLCTKVGSMNRQRIEIKFNPQRMCKETIELISRGLSS
ncbi:MAG: glycosyltransferase family 4 protein [Methanosarcinaceae archaeon]|nr:glycosyltransferase family 4 protein [Methanosarcinaceae archaeon]